uniref:Complex I assembly factor TIMMDC1, mitochondrial n=1 Tax=Caenorhabditis japonica TaxID=281687 RepID=A0A8R1I854_CAEJA
MTKQNVGWWAWIVGNGSETAQTHVPAPAIIEPPVTVSEPPVSVKVVAELSPETKNLTGWQRVTSIYEREGAMELDVVTRVVRMSFLGGFLVGGATGYAQARQFYEANNVGKKYLSPSDAVKRKIDYAIVRFAKGGFATGFKCALISGSIVLLTTHVTAYRDKFASWYFPVISALVGGVFTFPLGVIGSIKALGLGISSGLTLSAVVHLYAMAIDKSTDGAYRQFKRDYEKELKSALDWDNRVKEMMEREQIKWRQTAVKRLKQMDAEKMSVHDD